MNIEQQLVQHGKVSQGRIGVTIQQVSQSLAESFARKNTSDALVSPVEKGSPAAAAGLELGDVILQLNDQPVRDVAQLRALLDKSGRRVALLVERDNARIFVPVDVC